MSKQFGLKEVLNFTVHDFTTNAVLFRCDYATDSSLETTAERIIVRGGQGNYKLLAFDHTKDMMFKTELPLIDLESISMLTGKDMLTGAGSVPKFESLKVDGSNQVTLAATPVTGTLKVYLKSGSRDNGTEQTAGSTAVANQYTIAGQTITFNATSCPENTYVQCYYDYTSDSDARRITFTADKFPDYVRISGDSFLVDEVTGATSYAKIDIKKAKVKNNFTLTMKSTEVTKINMEYDVFNVDITNLDGNIDKVCAILTIL